MAKVLSEDGVERGRGGVVGWLRRGEPLGDCQRELSIAMRRAAGASSRTADCVEAARVRRMAAIAAGEPRPPARPPGGHHGIPEPADRPRRGAGERGSWNASIAGATAEQITGPHRLQSRDSGRRVVAGEEGPRLRGQPTPPRFVARFGQGCERRQPDLGSGSRELAQLGGVRGPA